MVTATCSICGYVYPQDLSDDALTRLIDVHRQTHRGDAMTLTDIVLEAIVSPEGFGPIHDGRRLPVYRRMAERIAARLIAQGVRVGDDGLRAAAQALVDVFPDWSVSALGQREALAALRLALAAQPAPALDRERLTRALVKAFPNGAFDLSHPSAAAAIADAYEADE